MDLQEQLRDGGAVVLSPSGRIDHRTANDFDEALKPFVKRCRDGEGDLVLDLTGTEYMSSVGLRVLMVAARDIKAGSGRMVLCGLQPLMREIITISRFDMVFQIYETADDAVAELLS